MAEQLLLATRNPGKLEEYVDLFSNLPLDWSTLDDIGISEEVEENGTTFEENAVLKARTYARLSGCLTIADDSGLEVDALDGMPGVRTARFGGPSLSPKERYEYLLSKLEGIPDEQRDARFCCVIAIAKPGQLVGTAHGICSGIITDRPQGSFGFGYDPVFFLPNLGRTMAQLTSKEKHKISHRGQAAAQIEPILLKLLQDG